MKEDYQKAVKKSTLFFLPNPVPFKGQIFEFLTVFELFQKLDLQIYASQFMTS